MELFCSPVTWQANSKSEDLFIGQKSENRKDAKPEMKEQFFGLYTLKKKVCSIGRMATLNTPQGRKT